MNAYTLPWNSETAGGAAQELVEWSQKTILAFVKTETMTGARLFPLVAQLGTGASQLDSDGFVEARRHSVLEAKGLEDQWKKLILDRKAPTTANALSATVKPLFFALTNLGAGAVDLRGLPADKVNGVHLAVVLRATLSHKERTPGWDEALLVARNALRRDRMDESDALLGLI